MSSMNSKTYGRSTIREPANSICGIAESFARLSLWLTVLVLALWIGLTAISGTRPPAAEYQSSIYMEVAR